MKRRRFCHTFGVGAGIALAPAFIPRSVLSAPGKPGANDRIRVGLIGPGGRAHSLMEESPLDLQVVAYADCDLRQMERFDRWLSEKRPEIAVDRPKRYQDCRWMFDEERLDAVIVATPTHSRALICIQAMQAGLDVYAEKPLTLTIEEGRRLVEAEARYGTVLQVGTQQRSVPIDNFGADLVKNGALGKIHTVLCPNYEGSLPRPTFDAEPVPEGLDWDLWLHQTDEIPYTSHLHPGLAKWGPWREYDGAGQSFGVTGWGAHAFDQVQRALGTDHTTPVEVRLDEAPGPHAKVSLRYANGVVLKLDYARDEGPGLGAIFIGEKGRLEIDRNVLRSDPPEMIAGAPEPDDPSPLSSVAVPHLQNWIDCMRSRRKPNADAEIGHRSSVICHLVNLCRELGRPLKWDPVKEEFPGDEEANALRSRPRRKGYELPEIA